MRAAAATVAVCCLVGCRASANDGIPESLTGAKGDPARGRAIVANRQVGLCLLCHSGPFPEERFQGNLAPDLRGAGSRWSEAELRLRIVDSSRINPATIMPAYHRTEGPGAGGAGLARQAHPERGADRGRGGVPDDAEGLMMRHDAPLAENSCCAAGSVAAGLGLSSRGHDPACARRRPRRCKTPSARWWARRASRRAR